MAEIRTIHDEIARQLLCALLGGITEVQPEHPVPSLPQRIDLAFAKPTQRVRRDVGLGLLGRMAAQGAGMIEYFYKAPPPHQIDACVRKQLNHHHALVLEAKRQRRKRPKKPLLWVVTAGRPVSALRHYRARPLPGWPAGFFQTPRPSERMRFVVVRDLPASRDSLVLRLLGMKKAANRAMNELSRLPESAPERRWMAKSMLAFREGVGHHDRQGKETGMAMHEALKRWDDFAQRLLDDTRQRGHQAGLEKGRKEGHKDGERALLTRLLTRRFGALPASVVARIERAGTAQLERWGDRVLDARSLDDVFAPSRRPAGSKRTTRN